MQATQELSAGALSRLTECAAQQVWQCKCAIVHSLLAAQAPRMAEISRQHSDDILAAGPRQWQGGPQQPPGGWQRQRQRLARLELWTQVSQAPLHFAALMAPVQSAKVLDVPACSSTAHERLGPQQSIHCRALHGVAAARSA